MKIRLAHLRQEIAALVPGTRTRLARNMYFTLGDRAVAVYDELDSASARHAHTRARLISDLAALEDSMGYAMRAGWPSSYDQDLAEVFSASAALLHLLASTEVAESPELRADGSLVWEEAFGPVLDALTGETDLGRRAELMTRLYLAAYPVLGGDVAETISRVGIAYLRIVLGDRARLAAAKTTKTTEAAV